MTGPSEPAVEPEAELAGAPISHRVLRLTAVAGVVIVVAAGLWLRSTLVGLLPGPLAGAVDFAHLRHVHMHAGYYAVLFPLLWLVTAALGAPAPGRRLAIVYAAACAVSLLGFLRAGYRLEAIAGSTVVGVVWNIVAVRSRVLLRESTWLRTVPLGVHVASVFIPPIAVFTRRDPALAQELVHSFLAVLVFLTFLPAALARAGARPVPVVAWVVLGLGSAGFVGALHHAALGVVFALTGAAILWSIAAVRRPRDVVGLGFFVLGAAMIPVGVGLVPWTRDTAIAAIHGTLLGPLLVGLLPLSRPFQLAMLGLAFGMAGALLLPRLGVDPVTAGRLSLACAAALLLPLGRAAFVLMRGQENSGEGGSTRQGRRFTKAA